MKVSVCVPVYQTGKYLCECLDSILQQNLEGIEIICINDGSTDNSTEILHEYKKKKNFSLINIKNSGLSVARNVALGMATGEYVLFLDSDDMLTPNQLGKLIQIADTESLDVFLYGMKAFADTPDMKNQASKMNAKYIQRVERPGVLSGQNMIKLLVKEGYYRQSACGMLIRRSFLKRNCLRFRPGILHEDNLFTYNVLLLAERTELSAVCLYLRRCRQASIMTSQKNHKNVIGLLVCFSQMLELANTYIERMNFYILEPVWKVREYARSLYLKLSASEKRKVVNHFARQAEFFLNFLYGNKQNRESVKAELLAISDYSRLLEETIELQKKLIGVQDKMIRDLSR